MRGVGRVDDRGIARFWEREGMEEAWILRARQS
jgi:hypothetical protein